jgi:lactonase family protein with 7-bladed beta-propeller
LRKLLLVLALLLISACAQLDAPAAKIANTPVPGITSQNPSMDAIEIDQAGHRLYAADRSNQGVDVFDISAGSATYLQTIAMPAGPNGLALAPDLSRLFVGVENGSVVFVDIKASSPTFNKVINEVKTGAKSADLLDYSATRHVVYASNGVQGTITSIDASSGEVKGQFKVGFALEQPRFNPADGMLYVTSPDAGALFRLDPNDGTVKKKQTLGGCQPMGLAINPKSNQALISCSKTVLSYDLSHDKSEQFSQQPGGDIVSYDAKVNRFFVGAPFKPSQGAVAIFGGTPIEYITTMVTGAGGKSAAYDEAGDIVYTPDTRPNKAGLASFKMPVGGPGEMPPLSTLIPFGVLLAVIVLFFAIVGRNADPIRRPEPAPSRVRQNRVT